jgi:hypothetical protein
MFFLSIKRSLLNLSDLEGFRAFFGKKWIGILFVFK